MSREVKRVPLEFEWPEREVWSGYRMPDSLNESPCPEGEACRNGATAARAWVGSIAHLLLMLDDDLRSQALGRPIHPYLVDVPTESYGCRPSADIAEFGTCLAGREASFFGHDGIDNWRATQKLIEAAGLDSERWGICRACLGYGSVEAYEGQRAEAEAWERSEPPEGDGWQVWESVPEGSPVTPVFATAEELAAHLHQHPRALGPGGGSVSYESALSWVTGRGWMPSGMLGGSGSLSGAALVEEWGS